MMYGLPLPESTAPGEGVGQAKALTSTLAKSLEPALPPSSQAGALLAKKVSGPDRDQLLEDTFPGASG